MGDLRHGRRRREHPKLAEACELLADGRMDRRAFVRVATLLGVGAGTAYAMAGLPGPAGADQRGDMPFAPDDPNAKKGGVLRVGMAVQKVEDPATFSWLEMSNQARHVIEYLAMTGPDNTTRPMLTESWTASDDLRTWQLKLRQGVRFHNGDELTAEIVKWNLERWLDPDLAAGGIIGLSTFAAMLRQQDNQQRMIPGAIEAVDRYVVQLNLEKPVLSVPEDLYEYPTAIVHPSFEPPFSNEPIGTGPFTMTELVVGERCVLKRVTQTTDGKPFTYWGGEVYLDEIHYYNYEADNQLVALASGDVDAIKEFGVEQMEFARSLPAKVLVAETAHALVCRMKTSVEPFTDARVRQAVVKACNNAAIRALVFPEASMAGENHHVGEIHPEYFALPPLEWDVDAAKALLAEAGYPDGIELKIDVGNTDGTWHQTVCEVMRDQMLDAGIDLSINVMPASKFWEIWDKTAFGAVAWAHRPLGTMALSLAYRSGVPWNETDHSNPEFDAALDDAEATLDVTERTAKMEKVEQLLQDAAVMVQAVWRPLYIATGEQVNGYPAHPTNYHQFNKVWLG